VKKRDAEGFDCSVILKADDIPTTDDLSTVWFQAMRLYQISGCPLPPTPAKMATFPPCSLSVTERQNFTLGMRIGRVQFSRPDGSSLSDQVWTISNRSVEKAEDNSGRTD
jgi:hypothetical protein